MIKLPIGVEKSAFGLYCGKRALEDNKIVVYHSLKKKNTWDIFSKDTFSITTASPIHIRKESPAHICVIVRSSPVHSH